MTVDRAPLDPPLPGRKPAVPTPLPARKPAAPGAPAAPASSTAASATSVGEAIRLAAGPSGHSFSALLAQATQESGLDPKARNPRSTATGPFQFIERTWLDMVRRHGAAYGLGDLASAVTVQDGRPVVKDPALRKRILALREDPHVSAGMAARYLAEGREALGRRLGRPVSETESRIAYVMGAAGAARLLQAAERTPGRPAAEILPAAAKANRPLFYDGARSLTAREAVTRLKERMEAEATRLANLAPGEPEPFRDDAPAHGANPFLLAQEAGSAKG